MVFVVVVLALCVATQGCGYTTASTLSERYRTIHIPAARNSIKEYDLQAPLTNALIRKFTVDGRLRVVDAVRADLRLETDIKGYSLAPLTYDDEDRVVQFRVAVIAAARLVDAGSGKELWLEDRVRGTSFFVYRPSNRAATPTFSRPQCGPFRAATKEKRPRKRLKTSRARFYISPLSDGERSRDGAEHTTRVSLH